MILPSAPIALTAPADDRPWFPGLGGSLLLHGLIVAIVATVAVAPRIVPAERRLLVEILPPDTFEAPAVPDVRTSPTMPADRPVAPVPAGTVARDPGDLIAPRQMLSARTLADPRSRQPREMLAAVDGTERMIQLCDLEAMEQVHAWRADFAPSLVVAYAMADVAVAGETVDARGAAFRSGDSWYALSFRCGLAPDHGTVIAFAFTVGAAIPRDEWEAHNLPASAGSDD